MESVVSKWMRYVAEQVEITVAGLERTRRRCR